MDDLVTRQRQRRGQWIDDANDEVMVWRSAHCVERQAAKAGEDTHGRAGQRRDCILNRCVMDPIVAGLMLPRRPLKGHQRDARPQARGNGIGTDVRGERVGRVEYDVNFLTRQIRAQSVNAAETADPHGDRRQLGVRRSPGKRQDSVEARVIRNALGELPRFRSSAKQQNTCAMWCAADHGSRQ